MERYARVIEAVTGQPWAVSAAMAGVITEILSRRLAGERLSREEIEARTEAAQPAPVRKVRADNLAIVPIHGFITYRASLFSDVSGMTSLDRVGAQLAEALDDTTVDTIVLHIDSPGGTTGGVQELADAVLAARDRKRVVAIADTLAASAAYWIASQATELSVTPSGEVGSIGVYTIHRDVSRSLQNQGITTSLIAAGAHKTDGNPFEPLSSDARAHLQDRVDEMYRGFVGAVARGRGATTDHVEAAYGQGRTLLASRALAAGMVDRVETFEALVDRHRRSDTPPRSARRRRPPPETAAVSPAAANRRLTQARLRAGLVMSALPPARGATAQKETGHA